MSEPSLTQKRAAAILDVGLSASAEDRQRAFDEKRGLLEQKLNQAPTPGLQAKYRHTIDTLTRAYETLEFAATERELERLKRDPKAARATTPAGPAGTPSAPADARRSPRDFIIAQIIVLILALVLGGWRWKVSRRTAEVARVAAVAKAESDRISAAAKAAERARIEEAERQEALARATKIEAERRAAEERVAAQRNEEERLKTVERQTRVRLIELETQFEGLDQTLKDVDRAIADQKSAERDLAKTEGWQLDWAQRRRSLLESYRTWLGDFTTRHPAKVRLKAASQLLQSNDIDGAANEARAGVDEWSRYASDPERRRFSDVGQALVEWLIGPKEWPNKEIFARARLDESSAVARTIADLKSELAYLDDSAKKPVFTDWRGRLLPLGWLAGEEDKDFVRWRSRFVTKVFVSVSPPNAQLVNEAGEVKGTGPTQLDLMRGSSVRLTAQANGFTPATVTANIGFEDNQEVKIELLEISAPKEGYPFTVPDLGLSLVWVRPGNFLMGSPRDEAERLPDEGFGSPLKVTLSHGFWLGKYEVTQSEWMGVMGTHPSQFKSDGERRPVESISWREARDFCRLLTNKERLAGRLPPDFEYMLPTEAQWEYACRAGTTTSFAGSLDKMGWYGLGKGGSTHIVGEKQPNAWGLYDMHGNVWEWCRDWYGDYPTESGGTTLGDPTGPATGTYRVNRGGCWSSPASKCRSALRNWLSPSDRGNGLGFRLALTRIRQ